jgi:hypothetical protein
MVSGMSDHEFTMSLGVRHPDIDPAQITLALGLQPGHVWTKGDQRKDHAGAALGGSHRESYWLCELVPRPRLSGERINVQSEVSGVLQMLGKSIGFMQDLHHGGATTELFVTVFARGDFHMELLPEEAALLGRIGVALTIEIRSGQSKLGTADVS